MHSHGSHARARTHAPSSFSRNTKPDRDREGEKKLLQKRQSKKLVGKKAAFQNVEKMEVRVFFFPRD